MIRIVNDNHIILRDIKESLTVSAFFNAECLVITREIQISNAYWEYISA